MQTPLNRREAIDLIACTETDCVRAHWTLDAEGQSAVRFPTRDVPPWSSDASDLARLFRVIQAAISPDPVS